MAGCSGKGPFLAGKMEILPSPAQRAESLLPIVGELDAEAGRAPGSRDFVKRAFEGDKIKDRYTVGRWQESQETEGEEVWQLSVRLVRYGEDRAFLGVDMVKAVVDRVGRGLGDEEEEQARNGNGEPSPLAHGISDNMARPRSPPCPQGEERGDEKGAEP
jgi:hypothetical protein